MKRINSMKSLALTLLSTLVSLVSSNGEVLHHRKLVDGKLSEGVRADRYIVFLDESIDDVHSKFSALIEKIGGNILHKYSHVFSGVCIEAIGMELLQSVLDADEVLVVEEVRRSQQKGNVEAVTLTYYDFSTGP